MQAIKFLKKKIYTEQHNNMGWYRRRGKHGIPTFTFFL